jgi:biofilm protein TabA
MKVSHTAMSVVEGELTSWRMTPGIDGLESVFEYLERHDLAALPLGRTPIEGDDVFALVSEGLSRPPQDVRFEAHRRYIDVQYVLEGQEAIGCAPCASLATSEPYDKAKDVEFFRAPGNYARIALRPGRFAVFAPEDGHQPGCDLDGAHTVRKVVVKVSVALRDRRRDSASDRA